MNIIDKIDDIDAEKVKTVFKELMTDYLTPAFGSISKRDFDILLFMKFQKLGIFNDDLEIYDILSSLKVTRAKARNLLYESKLRNTSTKELDEELKKLFQKPILLKDTDKIVLEIGNPFLMDHLKSELKKLGHITDGSFSPEVVKLTAKAYSSLFKEMVKDTNKVDEIKRVLIECGISQDTSFNGVMVALLKKMAEKLVGNVAGDLVDNVSDYLSPIINGKINSIKEKIKSLLENKKK